jgi:hypothetical protein
MTFTHTHVNVNDGSRSTKWMGSATSTPNIRATRGVERLSFSTLEQEVMFMLLKLKFKSTYPVSPYEKEINGFETTCPQTC